LWRGEEHETLGAQGESAKDVYRRMVSTLPSVVFEPPSPPGSTPPRCGLSETGSLGGVPDFQIRDVRKCGVSGLDFGNSDRVCEATLSVINTYRAPT
jgi:hypothetical protein